MKKRQRKLKHGLESDILPQKKVLVQRLALQLVLLVLEKVHYKVAPPLSCSVRLGRTAPPIKHNAAPTRAALLLSQPANPQSGRLSLSPIQLSNAIAP